MRHIIGLLSVTKLSNGFLLNFHKPFDSTDTVAHTRTFALAYTEIPSVLINLAYNTNSGSANPSRFAYDVTITGFTANTYKPWKVHWMAIGY